MNEDVDVTEDGEIVVRGCDGEAMAYKAEGSWWSTRTRYRRSTSCWKRGGFAIYRSAW